MTAPPETSSPAPPALDYEAPVPPARSRAWLFFSVLAILLWGVWGALSKAASNAVPSPTDLQVISTVGVVPIALLLVFSPNFLKRTGSLGAGVFFGFLTGLCGSVGNLALFASLASGGDASTVLPLSGVYPLVTVVLAVIILRERLNGIQLVGMGLALGALYLFNAPQASGAPATGPGGTGGGAAPWWRTLVAPWMALALVALVLYGIAGVTQKLATNHVSTELSTVCFALAFVPVALVTMWIEPVNWSLRPGAVGLALLTGALISTGTLTLFAAYRTGKASVVTAVTALYPALTVVLAVPLFDERIDARKVVAITLALGAGVALTFERPAASVASEDQR